ncbi:MAG TPA: hypothetical protein VGI14_07630 [Casimicrobiaceae bacterium]
MSAVAFSAVRRGRIAWVALGAVALASAAWLRFWQLDGQVLIDDEWHAIHRLLVADVSEIVTRLGYADYSIPLTVLFRVLYDHAMLSERWMHVPAAIAGVALLVVGPWLLRPWFDLRVRMAWIALMAISPLLVYHSKVARPYPYTVLLALVAIVCFERWWRERRIGNAVAYGAATFVAGYMHPVVLPFVLMPLAYHGIGSLRPLVRERSGRPLIRCIALGLVVFALLAIALLPPVVNDWYQFAAKAGRDAVTMESVYRTALMLAGSRHAAVAAVIFGLAVYGWFRLRRRDAAFARYLAVVHAVSAVAVAASGATWIFHPLVYARYLLPALPFLLLLAAEGAVGILERARMRFPAALVAIGTAVLFLAGPLPDILYYPNQFFGHLRFQYDYDPDENPYVTQVPKEPVPAFYRELAREPPGSVTLIELPWRLESNFDPHPWYQEVHRQSIRIGLVTPVCGTRTFGEYPEGAAGLVMRNFVHLSAILRGETFGADYLVVHLKPWKTPPDAEVEWPDMRACLPRITARLGPPLRQDDDLVVYRLAH